jgi:hypothetical protein
VIASIMNGGIFSLLPSPSTIVEEYLTRLALGVLSGVGGRGTSQGDGAGNDAVDDVASGGAPRFPRTELRVCMAIKVVLDNKRGVNDDEEEDELAIVVVVAERDEDDGKTMAGN